MESRRTLILALIAIVAVTVAAVAVLARGDDGGERLIEVSGSAEQRVAPDLAILRLGVSARASSARAATSAASASLQRVIEAAREAGIEEIQTEPVRVTRNPPRPTPEGPREPPFVARQTIEVRTGDLKGTGAVVEAAVAAGANEVNGPRFTLADPSAARRGAVAAAVRDARATARATATAADVQLGEVRRVQQGGTNTPLQRSRDAVSAESATPPTEPGLLTVSATVTVTFAVE